MTSFLFLVRILEPFNLRIIKYTRIALLYDLPSHTFVTFSRYYKKTNKGGAYHEKNSILSSCLSNFLLFNPHFLSHLAQAPLRTLANHWRDPATRKYLLWMDVRFWNPTRMARKIG